jgi:hypothetical protein
MPEYNSMPEYLAASRQLERKINAGNPRIQQFSIFRDAIELATSVYSQIHFPAVWHILANQYHNQHERVVEILYERGWRAHVLADNEGFDEIEFMQNDAFGRVDQMEELDFEDEEGREQRRKEALKCVNENFCAPCA